MLFTGRFLPFVLLSSLAAARLQKINTRTFADPCAEIADKKWVAPAKVVACYRSLPVDPLEQINLIDVVSKTLAFHTSTNYQIQAPPPFEDQVHADVIRELSRINNTQYPSDFDLHLDLSNALKGLKDGHAAYINLCYDSTFITYIPLPLTYLTDPDGTQHIHIAPVAFVVAQAEFPDQLSIWQNALPRALKGKLESLSGARVLSLNGKDPYVAVDANAATVGGYQGLGIRQNGFFSSYQRSGTGWNYLLGQFAQQALPLNYEATLTVLPVNSSTPVTFTLPYRSRIGESAVPWTDGKSFRKNNCVAQEGTNGVDQYETTPSGERKPAPKRPITKFQQQPQISPEESRRHSFNVLLDSLPLTNVALPAQLEPTVKAVDGSAQYSQFYMLNDNTGVLALGSFIADTYEELQNSMLYGLTNLTKLGATQLIVDVSNNGGGYVCAAYWLRRIIAGPKDSTEPNAGLYTQARVNPLAQEIVKKITADEDPDKLLMYNSLQWKSANGTQFPAGYDWLADPIEKVINGNQDAFSQQLGDECRPFEGIAPPKTALFDPKKVAIVSNGRCASSCALFSITMAKKEGAKTVVMGGKNSVKQQYCGVVGGQSLDFSAIDSEIKTTKLKDHPLAPPDFLTNSVQGITWRLSLGVDNPEEPEEWQDHPADFNLPLTTQNVNNPSAIWKDVAAAVFA